MKARNNGNQPTPDERGVKHAALSRLAQLDPVLIASGLDELALAWARHMLVQFSDEQREALGAWPGTLSEARYRVRSTLLPWLAARGISEAELPEPWLAASGLNSAARRAWARLRDARDRA